MKDKQRKYVFFSMRDFKKDGGGSIRMYGLLNSLASNSAEVTFISNATAYEKFHPSIVHIPINHVFTQDDKRSFQFLIGVSTALVNYKYGNFLKNLKKIFSEYEDYKTIYFFEYLDNSIGYWLFKNKIIKSYSNDIHGIATLEFKFNYKSTNSLKGIFINWLKYRIAKNLDSKVLGNSKFNIYVSSAMENYYFDLHSNINKKQSVIIPNLIDYNRCLSSNSIIPNLKEDLCRNLNLEENDKIILFAGGFKPTAGVLELIKAFQNSLKLHTNIKLLLIGNGPSYSTCKNYVNKNNLNSNILFLGRIPYDDLPTYQSISDILVCPDQMNEFSDKIIHFKYLDALLANKVVINGNFKSVLEINQGEKLSIGFNPRMQKSLNETLLYVIENYDSLKHKYSNTKDYLCKYLSYNNFIDQLPTSKN